MKLSTHLCRRFREECFIFHRIRIFKVTSHLATPPPHDGFCDFGRLWLRLFIFATGRNRSAARLVNLKALEITLDDVKRALTPYDFPVGKSVVPLGFLRGTLVRYGFCASTWRIRV